MTGVLRADADPQAEEWMRSHASKEPLVIAYDVAHCCGGGKICSVSVRERSPKDERRDYASAMLGDGTRLLVDQRAARRLPSRFGLTVRGVGPFRHLDLELTGEQWGALLYD